MARLHRSMTPQEELLTGLHESTLLLLIII